MNSSRYSLLGYAVWTGAKWYLRRRLPTTRTLAIAGLGLAGTLGGASVLVKRLGA